MTVAGDLACPLALLQQGMQRMLALMAEDMRDVLIGVAPVVRPQRLHRPEKLHNRLVLYRFHSHQPAQISRLEVDPILNRRQLLVLDLEKEGDSPRLHFLNRQGGQQNSVDSIRTILPLVKLPQVLSNLWVR